MTNFVLVLDTETTGLPESDPDNKFSFCSFRNMKAYEKARLIQIAYTIVKESEGTYERVVEFQSLVKFPGMDIQNSHIHGITTKDAEENGLDIKEVLAELCTDISRHNVTTLVAHNVDFDLSILLSESYRFQNSALQSKLLKLKKFCTCKQAKVLLNLEKRPKLVNLYKDLFGSEFENQHNALADMRACLECFKVLRQKERESLKRKAEEC